MGTPVPNRKIEDAATASSEVKTYRLTPEEIAIKYGPPVLHKKDNRPDTRLAQACKTCNSIEDAAKLLGTTIVNLKRKIGFLGVTPKWDREVADMAEDRSQEVKKTRLEIAWEKLTKEKYLELKEQGLSDNKMQKQLDIAPDVFTAMKREWGFEIAQKPVKQEEPPRGITITQAIKLQTELTDDVICLNEILCDGEGIITERVQQMLTCQRDIYQTALDRINEAFSKTVLAL